MTLPRPSRISYASKRREVWVQNADAWPKLASEDLFIGWNERRWIPDSLVEDISLVFGLECAYADDWDNATVFFRRAIPLADRIIAEDKCRANPINEAGYPANLAVVVRGRAYCRWLLGEGLNRQELWQAADWFTSWCLTKALDAKRIHDSMTMNSYVQGVRAAMIACDLDFAANLLRTRHKFRWHHAVERDLWTRLITAYPDLDTDLASEVEDFFDRVRDPDFEEKPDGKIPTSINRDILALETGIIRQMYVVNPSALDRVDPRAVIGAVAR